MILPKIRSIFTPLAAAALLWGTSLSSRAATKTDSNATTETQALYTSLLGIMSSNTTIFGQQFATWEGITSGGAGTWQNQSNRSDCKTVTGYHPGLSGWDFQSYLNTSATKQTAMVNTIIADYQRNMVIAVHWPMNNLITGGGDNDTTGMGSTPSILAQAVTSGTTANTNLLANLDAFATFLGRLKVSTTPIPVIFRPFHEMNGAGHWWGTGTSGNYSEYMAMWNYTLAYLRDTKGIHQLIYAFAPAGNKLVLGTTAEYLQNWPGDTSVDVCGVDLYLQDTDPNGWNAKMETAYDVASTRSMVAAFTELGRKNGMDGTSYSTWWTSRILADFSLATNPLWGKCAYMMTWTQQDSTTYYIPYPGHTQDSDFNSFVGDSHVLLQPDLPSMY